MKNSPDSPDSLASAGRDSLGTHPAQSARDEPGELKVPRSIVRWSKWRKAALRAEHRESRRRLRATQAADKITSCALSGNAPLEQPGSPTRRG